MDQEDLLLLPSARHPETVPWARLIYCIIIHRKSHARDHLTRALGLTPAMDGEDAKEAVRVIMELGSAVTHVSTYRQCVRIARQLASRGIQVCIQRVGYEDGHLLHCLRSDRTKRRAMDPVDLEAGSRAGSRSLKEKWSIDQLERAMEKVLSIVTLHYQKSMTPAGVQVALMRYGMTYVQAFQCAGMVMLNSSCVIRRQLGPALPPDHAEVFKRENGYDITITTIHLP